MLQAKAVKYTFDSKSELRDNGFVWNKDSKSWERDFASKEEYDAFMEHFLDVTYYGRHQVNKYNSKVVFEVEEIAEEVEEVAEVAEEIAEEVEEVAEVAEEIAEVAEEVEYNEITNNNTDMLDNNKNQSKEMFLLDVLPGGVNNEENLDRGSYPEKVFYFENADKLIEVINDNLSSIYGKGWMSEYHLKDDQGLTVNDILDNHKQSQGTGLTFIKNDKFADDNWVLSQVFDSLPKTIELMISVIKVYY